MGGVFGWRFVLYGALVTLALATSQGCAENEAAPGATGISWNSSSMRDVEKQWQALWDAEHKAPSYDKNSKVLAQVEHLFRKRLSAKDLRQLARSCAQLPIRERDRGDFTNAVLAFVVKGLVDLEDRESLVTLLSTRCVNRIAGWDPIEFHLAYRGKRLTDSILILGEAYSKCAVPEVRRDLAAAVRRAFTGLGISEKDDGEFVRRAMQWYEKKKRHLAVNGEYWRNDMFVPLEFYEGHPEYYEHFPGGCAREPLFITKGSPAERATPTDESLRAGSQPVNGGAGPAATGSSHGVRDEQEPGKLEGTWEVLDIMHNGKSVPREKIQGFRFRFSRETLTWIRPNGKKEAEFRIAFPEARSQKIDLTWILQPVRKEGATMLGLYGLKKDRLRLCLSQAGAYRRPTCFEANQDSNMTLITLKRLEK